MDTENVKPLHFATPKEIPAHLRKAVYKELKRCLDAGQLEECHHHTPWLSRGTFVGKPAKNGVELKARLVSDFRILNRSLRRLHYRVEGSSQLLKRLDRNHKFWAVLDFTSGYHQCALHPDDRDVFSIILPQGKCRECIYPKGASPSSDVFLILSDRGLRDCKWI